MTPPDVEARTVEMVARAISLEIWRMDYTPREPHHIPDERYGLAQAAARAAINAILASLAEQGMVLVPREPTEAMIDATENIGPEVEDTWRAMVDAAAPPLPVRG